MYIYIHIYINTYDHIKMSYTCSQHWLTFQQTALCRIRWRRESRNLMLKELLLEFGNTFIMLKRGFLFKRCIFWQLQQVHSISPPAWFLAEAARQGKGVSVHLPSGQIPLLSPAGFSTFEISDQLTNETCTSFISLQETEQPLAAPLRKMFLNCSERLMFRTLQNLWLDGWV